MSPVVQTFRLPPLREELSLAPGPADADGAPTWSLHDPVRNRFFRIDWATFLILSHWHLAEIRAICAAVEHDAPIELSADDVETVLKFLAESELLQCSDARATRRLVDARSRLRHSALTWLLHHYLSFRIPLVHPDAWLARAAGLVEPFYTAKFLKLSVAAFVLGAFETLRQWPHFRATFVDTISWEGLAGYAVVLVAVKMLHELGHAFTAKRYGCRVPTMGVAFLVMWPVAYTDLNETWKLRDRRQRLAVSAAGVLTELAIAAWATLAWSLLPDGGLRAGAFLLAAVTWISTLAINASPFMRFDGYFLLSDWLDIPNLHARAFALARWRLRELLFALGEDKPEYFSAGRERFLVLFAWLTWVYRLVLFLGIAVLVYRHFFKALGLILFGVEIAWFVALPIAHELREWWTRRRAIVSSSRARVTAAFVAVGLVLCAAPLDRQIAAPAILRPVHVMTLFAPDAGVIVVPPKSRGEVVHAGEALMQLSSPELLRRRGLADAGHAQLEAQLAAAALDPELRVDLPVLRERLAAIQSELRGLAQESARLSPVAAFAGTVVDAEPDLRSGDAVARNERLATLIDPTLWEVRAYFEEGDVRRVSVGDRARFYAETAGVPPIDITVALIDSDASRALGEPMLASVHGGRIPVRAHRESGGSEALLPERAIYGVTFRAAHPRGVGVHEERGTIVIEGSPRTILGGYVRTAAAVIIREAGW